LILCVVVACVDLLGPVPVPPEPPVVFTPLPPHAVNTRTAAAIGAD
jgi:hypothetical protein